MLKNKIWAFVIFILGVSFIYVTRYMLTPFSNMMPDAYLKTLFWIGYWGIVIYTLGIKPISLFVSDDGNENMLTPVFATMSFIIGCVAGIMFYYIYQAIFDMNLPFTSEVSSIIWFMYIIVTVGFMILVPIFMMVTNPNVTEQLEKIAKGEGGQA